MDVQNLGYTFLIFNQSQSSNFLLGNQLEMHQRRSLQPPDTPVAPLDFLNKSRITNTEIGSGTGAVLASSRTMGDASVARGVTGIWSVSLLARASVGSGAVGIQARFATVGFADGTGLVEGPTRIAATNVWTYTFAVLAPFGTLSHASVLDQLEAGLAGALVGADADAGAAAALAEEFALIGVPVEGKSRLAATRFGPYAFATLSTTPRADWRAEFSVWTELETGVAWTNPASGANAI
jgi:hypothetical protein